MNHRKSISAIILIFSRVFSTRITPFTFISPALAITSLPATVIDDFEDGDASDWIFFGGNAAGGGGDVLADRPQVGSFYGSTCWGGGCSDSVFDGGFFRNLTNLGQYQRQRRGSHPIDPTGPRNCFRLDMI